MDRVPPVPEGYDNACRAFLQGLLARGSFNLDEGKQVLAAVFTASRGEDQPAITADSVSDEDFNTYIGLIREAVTPLDLDVRQIRDQVSGERIWAIINMHSDPSTQLATIHNAEEIAFIKRLLDSMFDTYNTRRMEAMCVTDAQARKVARPARGRESIADGDAVRQSVDKGLRRVSEVDAVLTSLVNEGWLQKSRAGFYSLSPRALMELWGWLNETYSDPDADGDAWQRIKFCEACKEIVTVGQRCADPDCHARLHDICQDAYWRTRRERNCPRCDTLWDGKHFVGERAITETEAYRRANPRKGKKSGGVAEALMEENAAEGDEDEDGDSVMVDN